MNIWALRKSPRIKRALLALSEQVSGFDISGIETLTDEAVRLSANDGSGFCVYLYTYGQPEGRYAIHLEYPQTAEIARGQVIETLEDLDLKRLTELLQTYFY